MSPKKTARKVLVVDDDEDIVGIVESLLKSEGYQTLHAANGRVALEKALSFRPDLIISDIMMPEMDGWEFCWRVRAEKALAQTPFIFLTARADVMDQIRGSEIGADDYVIKPFRKQEFLERVANVFGVISVVRQVKREAKAGEAKKAARPRARPVRRLARAAVKKRRNGRR